MSKRFKHIIVFLVCCIVIATAYFNLIKCYRLENEKPIIHFHVEKQNRKDRVSINANIVSVDAVKAELVVRMQFEPQSDLLDNDDLLINPVTVYTNSASGKAEVTYEKGESMQPIDITVSLKGESSHFPWDRYSGMIWICIAGQKENEKDKGNWFAVPFTFDLKTAAPGFAVDVKEQKQKNTSFSVIAIDFNIRRAASSFGFSVFVMILIGILTLVAFLSGFTCVMGDRKIELSMLGWLATLLFAMLPLRNAMPGAPPIGCLADYLSFFWAEAITAITLIAAAITWLLKKTG